MVTRDQNYSRPAKSQRRVVVTGIGALTPLGLSISESWLNIIEGKSGIDRITHYDVTGHDVQIAGEIKNFDPDLYVNKKEQKKMGRFIHLSIAAAKMAIDDCGLSPESFNTDRVGVVMGVGIGGMPNIEQQHQALLEKGMGRISPFFVPMIITNLAPGHISMMVGSKGVNYALSSACASGAHAIGEATRYIRDGIHDIMICGGAESSVCPLAIGGFASMRALSTRNEDPSKASRPFDKGRDGFVFAEGAAVLILEEYSHALARGAKIYGEVSGYGFSSDAYHMTNPEPTGVGARRAMEMALSDAQLPKEAINYINAHGTSTPVGDEIEARAVLTVFAEHSKNLLVSSTKSSLGHTLGAAGAVESAICLMALKNQIVPPTLNLEDPIDSPLDFVPLRAREAKLHHVLNNSFGFGGTNSSLIFSKV